MDDTKKCPYCGETIQRVARKCKWCGEWLEEDKAVHHTSNIPCPVCGEQIPEGSKACPYCKESVVAKPNNISKMPNSPVGNQNSIKKSSNRSVYILIGVIALAVIAGGGILVKNYLNDREYQERVDNSPYNTLRKNLEEAVAKGQNLTYFLRNEKNVEALKEFFGAETYNLMLNLSAYSDEPLVENDPKDNTSGGYAWRSPYDKNKAGIRFCLNDKSLSSQFFYDGLEVDQFGYIKTNDNWHKEYYKDDFNEDDKSKPYIEQRFSTREADDRYFRIRLDNLWGISICQDFSGFDLLQLRNNDTGEVWTMPITLVGQGEAVLKKEGYPKFLDWFQNGSSLTLSAASSHGDMKPSTATLYNDKTRWRESFEQHVMKRQIQDEIFVRNDLN